jgi:hypothetical protein
MRAFPEALKPICVRQENTLGGLIDNSGCCRYPAATKPAANNTAVKNLEKTAQKKEEPIKGLLFFLPHTTGVNLL